MYTIYLDKFGPGASSYHFENQPEDVIDSDGTVIFSGEEYCVKAFSLLEILVNDALHTYAGATWHPSDAEITCDDEDEVRVMEFLGEYLSDPSRIYVGDEDYAFKELIQPLQEKTMELLDVVKKLTEFGYSEDEATDKALLLNKVEHGITYLSNGTIQSRYDLENILTPIRRTSAPRMRL